MISSVRHQRPRPLLTLLVVLPVVLASFPLPAPQGAPAARIPGVAAPAQVSLDDDLIRTSSTKAQVEDVGLSSAPAMSDNEIPAGLTSTFIQDTDLGNGQHAALISASPLNYRTPDGAWRPINARFAADTAGWANLENTLQIRADRQQVAMQLAHEGLERRS